MQQTIDDQRRTLIRNAGIGLGAIALPGGTLPAFAASPRTAGRFAGRRVLVTGGSSGMGRAGARALAAEGACVVVTGMTPAKLAATREDLPADAKVLANDAGDPAAVAALVAAVRESGRDLDGIWFNAAIATIGGLESIDAAGFDRMMAVNVRGPMLQMAALSPLLKQGASIVVTSSSSVYEGAAQTSLYAATKGAVLAMARSWARQLAPRGIRVNVVVPGPIATDFRRFLPERTRTEFEASVVAEVPLARMGTAEEAAAVALFLLSDAAAYVSGSQYAVDGGMMMR